MFHRSCVSGLSRTTCDAIVKNPRNLFWLCDNCCEQFDGWLQSTDTDNASPPVADSAKLCEAVDKLSGIVTELSKRIENGSRDSYSGVVRSGTQAGSSAKRLREDDQGRERVKAVCGTRTIQREIKTVADEREQFWVYLGRLHNSHTVDDIAEISRECLALEELPKAIRLVKKDVDVSKLPFVSFRVLLPEETRETALLAETWPVGVAVREFDFDQVSAPRFR